MDVSVGEHRYKIELHSRHYLSNNKSQEKKEQFCYRYRGRVWTNVGGRKRVWHLPPGYRLRGGKPCVSIYEAFDLLFDFLSDQAMSQHIEEFELIYETPQDISIRQYKVIRIEQLEER